MAAYCFAGGSDEDFFGCIAADVFAAIHPLKKAAKMYRITFLFLVAVGSVAFAGPYTEAGIYKDSINADPDFWAKGIIVERGFVDITNPELGYASFGSEANALGKAEGTSFDVVSLGDGGIATLTFDNSIYITNGDGDDFAVFENGFGIANGGEFLELAFVEVSSDGVNFFCFDSVSLTATNIQVDGFSAIEANDIHNLAGRHLRGYGTPFDLEELKNVNDLLDVNSITHIRITDVVGYVESADIYGDGIVNFIDYSIFAAAYLSKAGDDNWNEDCDIFLPPTEDPPYHDPPNDFVDIVDFQVFIGKWLNENDFSSCDSTGHQINDPWPTPFDAGGFDLDAVGIINERPRQIE